SLVPIRGLRLRGPRPRDFSMPRAGQKRFERPGSGTHDDMRLLQRNKTEPDDSTERPLPEEAPEPPPEHAEPRVSEPGPTDLSTRDYFAIVRRALKEFNADHMTSIAAALAYYAFLAIPSALLIAAGLFGLLAGPNAVSTVIGKLHGIVPAQAISLIDGSLS